MQLKALVLITLTALSFTSFAQTYKAEYRQVINFNKNPDTSTAFLTFSSTESIYLFEKNTSSTADHLDVSRPSVFAYYKNFVKKDIICREVLFNRTVLISDAYPDIKWDTSDTSKKEIANYSCKKAVGAYRGRIYTVWYTEAAPAPAGPWKLGGLPGLIVEAQDGEKAVTFTFVAFNKTSEQIQQPDAATKMTQDQYVREYKKAAKSMAKNLQTSIPKRSGLKVTASVKLNTLEKSLFE
jgi:GLPGLI family protein